MTEPDVRSEKARSQSWPLVVFVVILIGLGGLYLIRIADTDGHYTLGSAMITAALVAGPFLVAEVLLNGHEPKRESPEHLRPSSFAGADLSDADLSDRYLRRRSFSSSRLIHADLSRSDLAEASLDDAKLTRADFTFTNLRGASLKSASCFRADFTQSIMTHADLRWANLNQAILRSVDLVDADLENADLRGADLEGADLRGSRLLGARYSDTTVFPAELFPAGVAHDDHLRSLGLGRHPDVMTVETAAPRPRWRGLRSVVRSLATVGGAAIMIATINFALPERSEPTMISTPRVSGVVLERPYYRISGSAQHVQVTYRDTDGTDKISTYDALPASITVGPFTESTPIEVNVKSLDGGTVHCEIFVGGDLVSQSGSAGRGGIATCAAVS